MKSVAAKHRMHGFTAVVVVVVAVAVVAVADSVVLLITIFY
jgi:hypothetical protein